MAGEVRGPPRPRLDDPLLAPLVHPRDLDHQVLVHERPLLHRPRHQPRPFPRRRMICAFDAFFFFLVRPSFFPHGDVGWRPPDDLPSPPPCGWSTGFIATPRTDGRLPFQRIRPALPQLMLDCSELPTSPTVARQRRSTIRISPEGIRSVAYLPSLASNWAPEPAERASFAPPPGRS